MSTIDLLRSVVGFTLIVVSGWVCVVNAWILDDVRRHPGFRSSAAYWARLDY